MPRYADSVELTVVEYSERHPAARPAPVLTTDTYNEYKSGLSRMNWLKEESVILLRQQ